MLDKLGWCARNPPAVLGSGMASSSSRRRPHGPCRRRAPFRSRNRFRDSRRASNETLFEQSITLLIVGNSEVMGEDGAHDSASKAACDRHRFQSLGLGAMFTRDAIRQLK